MSTLLRRALESAEPEQEQTIEIKGPLSEVYTEALNAAYAKVQTGEDSPALESQAIDAMVAQSLARYTNPQPHEAANVTIYGVSSADAVPQDIVNVTTELADKPAENEFVLIIDATQPSSNSETSGAPAERFVEVGTALESICAAFGCKVYRSLKDFAQSR